MEKDHEKPPSLPMDVMFEIFLLLPVKTLYKLSFVCKSWHDLITSNEEFIRSYLHKKATNNDCHVEVLMHSMPSEDDNNEDLQQDYESVEDRIMKFRRLPTLSPNNPLDLGKELLVAGCCDGIVCFYETTSTLIYLWNPALHQCRTLTRTRKDRYESWSAFMGFGYDSTSQDYKVVKVGYYGCSTYTRQLVLLYSLKNNSWKSIKCSSPFPTQDSYALNFPNCPSLAFNRRLHWIARVKIPIGEESSKTDKSILSFDLVNGKLDLFQTPNSTSHSRSILDFLGVLKGCLTFINMEYTDIDRYKVWSMKRYGVPESWTRVITIDKRLIPCSYHPIGFSTIKEKILLLEKPHSVFSYELESTRRSKLVELDGDHSEDHHSYFVVDYVESLVSIMPKQAYNRTKFSFARVNQGSETMHNTCDGETVTRETCLIFSDEESLKQSLQISFDEEGKKQSDALNIITCDGENRGKTLEITNCDGEKTRETLGITTFDGEETRETLHITNCDEENRRETNEGQRQRRRYSLINKLLGCLKVKEKK